MKRNDIAIVSLFLLGLAQISNGGGFTLEEENDFFAFRNKDGHYTQGLSLSYAGDETSTNGVRSWMLYGIRNQFYTPEDIAIAEPQPNDRPWAGLTGVTMTDWSVNTNGAIETEYLVGVVGAWSQSECIQTTVHKWIGSHKPMGWSNQIPNEVVVNVTKKWFVPMGMIGSRDGWGADVTETYGGSLGNAFVNIAAGGMVRAGYRVPSDYQTEILYPTIARAVANRFSIYGVAGLEGRCVFQNIMLGGSLFQSGDSRILKPCVCDINYGLASSIDRLFGTSVGLKASYLFVHRSEEFAGQNEPVDFGSIILSVNGAF